jgi:hypothetical protein
MLQSPTWRALGNAERMVLDRLEIEHMRHAGKKNGNLICTYRDLVRYGIRRMSIAPAIRNLVAAGLMEITHQGRRSPDRSDPAHYRLTYLPTQTFDSTDEWREVEAPKPPKSGSENAPCQVAKTLPVQVAKTLLREPHLQGAKTLLPSRIYPSTKTPQGTESLAEQTPSPAQPSLTSAANGNDPFRSKPSFRPSVLARTASEPTASGFFYSRARAMARRRFGCIANVTSGIGTRQNKRGDPHERT